MISGDTKTVRHTLACFYSCPRCGESCKEPLHTDRRVSVQNLIRWEKRKGSWEQVSETRATEQDVETLALAQQGVHLPQPLAAQIEEPVAAVMARIQERHAEWIASRPPPPTEQELVVMRTAERLARARRAGVPEDLFSAITTPQDRPALLAAREWYKTDKRGLILCGPNQAGKSGAAAAWLSNVDRGLWISAEEIGLAVQPDPENKGVARLRQLREAGALVIDDLFRRCGPAGYETIEGLVLHMLDRGRRVVLTADRPSGDVLALFGEGRKNRIASRWERLGWIKSIESWVTTDPG